MDGIISDIQHFSLHDGPGIRTTVFLKGCNMQCSWCHNPEAISRAPQLAFYANRCIGCMACLKACQHGAISFKQGKHHFDADKCQTCFACAHECPTGALMRIGREMSPKAVFDVVLGDKPYYDRSGGGVTFSGGEPTMQGAFLKETLSLLKEAGISTALETNLSLPYEQLEALLDSVDLVMFDLKLFDQEEHIKYTGISNTTILQNVHKLSQMGKACIVRTPLIPGITDSEENIRAIAKFLQPFQNVKYYELLTYNAFAEAKYTQVFLNYAHMGLKRQTDDTLQQLAQIAIDEGLNVKYAQS